MSKNRLSDPLEAAKVGPAVLPPAKVGAPIVEAPRTRETVSPPDPPKPPPLPPRVLLERYRVLEDKRVSWGGSSTTVRKGDIVSEEMGVGTLARLREHSVKMELVE